jgi:hypothetical protein
MERYCATSQSPQQAVAPMEEEEEWILIKVLHLSVIIKPTYFNYPAGTIKFTALY